MDSENSFLGVGWSFPVRFDRTSRQAAMVTKEEDIDQSLRILLATYPGERILNEEYGCNLRQFMYEEASESLFSHIREVISDAILRFEARIDVEEIQIEHDNAGTSVLYITVMYRIRQTNSRHNMVYPFYLLEGNNISNL